MISIQLFGKTFQALIIEINSIRLYLNFEALVPIEGKNSIVLDQLLSSNIRNHNNNNRDIFHYFQIRVNTFDIIS